MRRDMHRKKPRQKHSKLRKSLVYLLLISCCVAIAGGLYVLFLSIIAPKITFKKIDHTYLSTHKPKPKQNKLLVPKINLTVPIKSGSAKVLNDSVWHRYPERGNPVKGGNFILAGHRFEMGLTPGEVRHKSPFYNVDELEVDDSLYVDFGGERFHYKIAKIHSVKPTAVSIEDPSPNNPHMTLYTCTVRGAADGRVVITAKLIDESKS